MLTLAAAMLLAEREPKPFPEQVPSLMEACLNEAVAAGEVSETGDSHKYICGADAADRFWAFLERAKLKSFEQDTPEGRWLSRDFPLGGCFKRIRLPNGEPATDGLSCTIWVPRVVAASAETKP